MNSQDAVRRFWNDNPMSYDVGDPIAHERGSQEYFRALDARVFDPRVLRLTVGAEGKPFSRFVDFGALDDSDVLEVGCGSGFASQLFAEAGARVTAVDLTDWAVETTRARFDAFGLDGTILQADAERLPFDDASNDVVFSWGVIHHTTNMDAALRELVRVLRPGGTLVLMLYHRRSLFRLFYIAFAKFLPLARRLGLHFEGARDGDTQGLIWRHFTRAEVKLMLEREGLTDVRVQPYGQDSELLPLPRRLRVPITDWLPRGLKDRVLGRAGHHLAIVARKRAG